MKKIVLFSAIAICLNCCCKTDIAQCLKSYLNSFGYDLIKLKVVCIVPADGCVSCINPFLDYSKNSNNGYLLVLSSIYEKSIDYIIEVKEFDKTRILCDSEDLAVSKGLVNVISPMVYFIKDGHLLKVVDTSTVPDRTSLVNEMNTFLVE